MREMPQNADELRGTVDRVVFRNEDNGWSVLELVTDTDVETVVGTLPEVHVGELLHLRGDWAEHPSFGRQFRATYCETQLPGDEATILRYLSAGAVKGIGPALAARIVRRFGGDTLKILEEEPSRLAEISGISPAKAGKIGEMFAAQFGLREVVMAFTQYGLTPNEAMRCYKRWGAKTVDTVRGNPYALCATGLYIGFERADAIARSMHGEPDDPHRVEAGILYVLRHNAGNGHTCLPEDKLTATAASLLEVGIDRVAELLDRMVQALTVRRDEIKGRTCIFLPHMYTAEKYAAARLTLMAAVPPADAANVGRRIDGMEKQFGIRYEAAQRTAISQAIERGVLVLTGGPGTGKTTTLKAIIALLEGDGASVAIAAPTGRAAKRIAELTGREAATIHRLLEVQWNEDDTAVFARNEKNPLDADAVIVDELSMVDVLLFESLLRALPSRCRLIMVGDSDQLPAVGAGCVLGDLIAAGNLPVVQLTEVFRQSLSSRIVSNAHRIVEGVYPELDNRDGDFFFLPQTYAAAVSQTVVDLCARRLPDAYGYSVFGQIQVLCPGRKGELGTVELNRKLQERLNPAVQGKREITVQGVLLREGDKVMQTRNNYDITWSRDAGDVSSGIFNGDIGVLTSVGADGDTLTVQFEDREAYYSREDAADLELAYAVTVHKSQGSEFEAVIIPVFACQPQLCYRNLLYTGVTRARSLLILVGNRDTVCKMVDNNRKTLRYSALGHFLQTQSEVLPWDAE